MENAGFYVQPNMLQFYHDQGYRIYKIVEVELSSDEIVAEVERAAQETAAAQASIRTMFQVSATLSNEEEEVGL